MTVTAITDPIVITVGETMAVLSGPVGTPLRMAPTLNLSIAGSESNVAIGLSRLGIASAWLGRVGNDELGRLILSRLSGEGIDVSGVVVDAVAPTGLMLKERRLPNWARVSYYRRDSAGSHLTATDIPSGFPGHVRHLHATGITPALSESARSALDAALTAGVASQLTISVDINYRSVLWPREAAAQELSKLAAQADIVFATESEARLITGTTDDLAFGGTEPLAPGEALCRAVAALGPGEVVLKLGALGATSLLDGEVRHVPAVPTQVIDPVGAGDAFVAGYLAARLRDADPTARLHQAVATASFALAADGDWEGLPTSAELGQWVGQDDPVSR